MRTLACEKYRWLNTSGFAMFSLEFRVGRRMRSMGCAPAETSGSRSSLAQVARLRILPLYVPIESDVQLPARGSFGAEPGPATTLPWLVARLPNVPDPWLTLTVPCHTPL